jgi:hypothetical protein
MVYKGSVIRIDRNERHKFWTSERYRFQRSTLRILIGVSVFLVAMLLTELLVGGRP